MKTILIILVITLITIGIDQINVDKYYNSLLRIEGKYDGSRMQITEAGYDLIVSLVDHKSDYLHLQVEYYLYLRDLK